MRKERCPEESSQVQLQDVLKTKAIPVEFKEEQIVEEC